MFATLLHSGPQLASGCLLESYRLVCPCLRTNTLNFRTGHLSRSIKKTKLSEAASRRERCMTYMTLPQPCQSRLSNALGCRLAPNLPLLGPRRRLATAWLTRGSSAAMAEGRDREWHAWALGPVECNTSRDKTEPLERLAEAASLAN